MLVLTRKLGEVVNIGNDVEVCVVGVSAGRVKLGFRAPRDVVIQRAEVTSRIEAQHSDPLPELSVRALDRNAFSAAPPLRLFRQLGSA
jgi:carbon storage regulator